MVYVTGKFQIGADIRAYRDSNGIISTLLDSFSLSWLHFSLVIDLIVSLCGQISFQCLGVGPCRDAMARAMTGFRFPVSRPETSEQIGSFSSTRS